MTEIEFMFLSRDMILEFKCQHAKLYLTLIDLSRNHPLTDKYICPYWSVIILKF